jgi:5-methylcytosine-specific restriction endonuclease McrA
MNKKYIFNKKKGVVLYIFKYECAFCSKIDTQNHVHHLDKNHDNNDAFNMAVLCKNCHIFLHKHCGIFELNLSDAETKALQILNSYF